MVIEFHSSSTNFYLYQSGSIDELIKFKRYLNSLLGVTEEDTVFFEFFKKEKEIRRQSEQGAREIRFKLQLQNKTS